MEAVMPNSFRHLLLWSNISIMGSLLPLASWAQRVDLCVVLKLLMQRTSPFTFFHFSAPHRSFTSLGCQSQENYVFLKWTIKQGDAETSSAWQTLIPKESFHLKSTSQSKRKNHYLIHVWRLTFHDFHDCPFTIHHSPLPIPHSR